MTRQVWKFDNTMVKCNQCSAYVSTDVRMQTAHNKQFHPVLNRLSSHERETAKGLLARFESMLIEHNGLTKEQVTSIVKGILELQKILKGD